MCVTETGERVLLDVAALGLSRRSYNSQYALPSLDDDHAYDYHRPGLGAHYTLGLTGTVEPRFRSVILYVSFMNMALADIRMRVCTACYHYLAYKKGWDTDDYGYDPDLDSEMNDPSHYETIDENR